MPNLIDAAVHRAHGRLFPGTTWDTASDEAKRAAREVVDAADLIAAAADLEGVDVEAIIAAASDGAPAPDRRALTAWLRGYVASMPDEARGRGRFERYSVHRLDGAPLVGGAMVLEFVDPVCWPGLLAHADALDHESDLAGDPELIELAQAIRQRVVQHMVGDAYRARVTEDGGAGADPPTAPAPLLPGSLGRGMNAQQYAERGVR